MRSFWMNYCVGFIVCGGLLVGSNAILRVDAAEPAAAACIPAGQFPCKWTNILGCQGGCTPVLPTVTSCSCDPTLPGGVNPCYCAGS